MLEVKTIKRLILVNKNEYSFPIIGGQRKGGIVEVQNLIGTAFSIGGGYFITAGHVLQQLENYEVKVLGYYNSEEKTPAFRNIDQIEILERLDIGLIKSDIPNYRTLKWCRTPVNANNNVFTIGFPFGLDFSNALISTRFFKGYIVSRKRFFRLEEVAMVYEVSFPCPRGLSGAFLVEKEKNRIIGIVIGNESNEIEIYQDEEVIEDSNEKTIYIKTEVLKIGIVLCVTEILECKSELLGSDIFGHLLKEDLV